VCIYVAGSERYAEIAREAALSVLDHSSFDICHVHEPGLACRFPRSTRVERLLLPTSPPVDRADVFNGKLEAWSRCIEHCSDDLFIMLDADAVFARWIGEADIREALSGRGMGMVEQKRIIGSEMGRRQLYEHYCRVSLAFDGPGLAPPAFADFRYFNTGVVLAKRAAAVAALEWARERVREGPRPHRVGEYMIADQDHLQVFANSIDPGCSQELSWEWNHCEHWDQDFPRDGARIAHFSNFCNGPTGTTARRMQEMRRRAGWRGRLRDWLR
jgi:hypothetical protein